MKAFLFSLLTFSIPLLIYLSVVLIIDPFNYLGGGNEDKLARNLEPHLYKMIKHKNAPKKNIVLGDSRSDALCQIIQKKRKGSWGNLAYGGASLQEMVDTFWWLEENYDMDSIIINVNFNHLNNYNRRDWISPTMSIMKNPIAYASSRYVFLYLYQKLLQKLRINFTNENLIAKEVFWSNHIASIEKKFYIDYKYSQSFLNDLSMIANSCEQRGVKLIIWSAPVHKDIHNIIDSYGHRNLYSQSLLDLQRIGEYYDFNKRLDWIDNKELFYDAMHVKSDIMQDVYSIIFDKKELKTFGNSSAPHVNFPKRQVMH